MRASVNLENHRVLLAGVEVRRLQNPCLDLFSIKRAIPDFFGLALPDVLEEILVHARDRSRCRSGAANGHDFDVSMFACVEIVAAMAVRFDVALYAITLWRPPVTGSTRRPAMSMRTRF